MTRTFHISENIKIIRRVNKLSQTQFGKIFSLSRDQVYTYESGVTVPQGWLVVRIVKYAKVSPDFLIYETLDEVEFPVYSKFDDNTQSIAEGPATYKTTNLTKTKVIDKHLDQNIIPVFPIGGSTSHTELYNDLGSKTEGFIRVPGYEDCDFATYVYGHSMYPVIESGCLILCRKIQGKQMILWGEIYYIITQDYRLIKRLQKGSNKTTVMAVSENDEKRRDGDRKYEGIEIELDDIKELYLVKGIIKKIQI